MMAGFKILADVALFRLKKLEMGNMFGALAIMLAIRLPADEVAVRFGFGLLLNLLAYLTNDYYDVDQDASSPNKDQGKARYLKAHLRAALYVKIFLALFLAVIAFMWDLELLVALVAGSGICWLYSAKLKRIPYLDVIAMISWGMAMPLVGVPLTSALGFCLVFQLALFCACFESIQVIRDYREDARLGVRTTAVRLGVTGAAVMMRFFMVLSALYGVLIINRWFGLALFAALLVPLNREKVDVFWNHIRLIQGLVWLAMVGWIYWYGSSTGLIAVIGPERLISLLP
jgi:4-hydroxybenzoate polyprenyltransferase